MRFFRGIHFAASTHSAPACRLTRGRLPRSALTALGTCRFGPSPLKPTTAKFCKLCWTAPLRFPICRPLSAWLGAATGHGRKYRKPTKFQAPKPSTSSLEWERGGAYFKASPPSFLAGPSLGDAQLYSNCICKCGKFENIHIDERSGSRLIGGRDENPQSKRCEIRAKACEPTHIPNRDCFGAML